MFDGSVLIGYITGVAYIINWTPKAIRNFKSLYFVVNELKIRPNPTPIRASRSIKQEK